MPHADIKCTTDLDIDVNESILDLAMTKYRNPRMLQWHYRSNHEDLIRFQNYFIYIRPTELIHSGANK